MTFIDLFAGIGGFRRGLELAGHKCVGFCEWDKYAAASYTSMHLITDEQREKLAQMPLKQRQKEILKEEYRNGDWYSTDIRLVNADNVPRCDCWCFGAPCQDFSVAGKRAGLEGDRSSLVREVFRVLGELEEADRPEWLIYENVKGMLSSNGGRDYLAILMEMDELGYGAEWFLFNSKYHGVPQNRERVYTVGHFRNRGSAKVFPIAGTDREDSVEGIDPENLEGLHGYPHRILMNKPRRQWETVNSPEGISGSVVCSEYKYPQQVCAFMYDDYNGNFRDDEVAETLTPNVGNTAERNGQKVCLPIEAGAIRTVRSEYGKAIRKDYEDGKINISRHDFLENEIREDGVTNTLDSVQKDNRIAIPVLTLERPEKRQNGRRFKEDGDPSFTLTSQDRHGVAVEVKETTKSGHATADTQCNQGIVVEMPNGVTAYAVWYPKRECYVAIRKLTPRECFRLQGWDDEYFDKAEFVNSDSQLYKQAGNGVTVNVVELIGRRLKEIEDADTENNT